MVGRTASVALAGATVVLLLVGCSLRKPLAYHAVEYNRVVEEAHNRMLLLNIVRASERRPMYFTAIGSITADLSYTASSGGLTFTHVGGSSADTTELGLPTLAVTANPTATVAVLDTQDFVRGTLAPVDLETVRYYLTQGWKPDLLSYLLVERVEVQSKPPLPPTVLENDPESQEDFQRFSSFVGLLRTVTCAFEEISEEALVGQADTTPTYEDLMKAQAEGFKIRLKPQDPASQQEDTSDEDEQKPKQEEEPKVVYQVLKETKSLELLCKQRFAGSQAKTLAFRLRGESGGSETIDREDKDKIVVDITLRSPQGILYYLGEVLRVWNDETRAGEGPSRIPLILSNRAKTHASEVVPCPGSHGSSANDDTVCVPLFMARERSPRCAESQVGIQYEGRSYIVPKAPEGSTSCEDGCCSGRSMQALTLVSQLLALQKKGEDLPGVTLVRSVGQ